MTVIMPIDEPRPRGTFMGERVGHSSPHEVDHLFKCVRCGGWFDGRDLVWVEDHEGPLPHPAQDRAQ